MSIRRVAQAEPDGLLGRVTRAIVDLREAWRFAGDTAIAVRIARSGARRVLGIEMPHAV
jgi:hypothetical protein